MMTCHIVNCRWVQLLQAAVKRSFRKVHFWQICVNFLLGNWKCSNQDQSLKGSWINVKAQPWRNKKAREVRTALVSLQCVSCDNYCGCLVEMLILPFKWRYTHKQKIIRRASGFRQHMKFYANSPQREHCSVRTCSVCFLFDLWVYSLS